MNMKSKLFKWVAIVALLFCGLSLSAQQVSLDFTNTPIKTVLKSIETQSDFTFVYSSALDGVGKNVSISVKNEPIEKVLNTLFQSAGIVYKITEKQIVLTSKEMAPSTASPQQSGTGDQTPPPQSVSKKTITGTVIGADDKQPLIGVGVFAKGVANIAAATDIDGRFSITVPLEVKSLNISYIGYQSTEINIGTRSLLSIELVPEATLLTEVVVSTGYINEKRKNISGAVASVSSKDLQMAKVDNIQRALEGKAAGVQIVSSSGLPGAAVNINIRGKSSISAGLTPLYIVDGVQMTTGDFSTVVQTSNVLAGLNPDDIESVDILKDAATASIYGAQAANGVIIIKTRRGSQGKPKISFSAKLGIDNLIHNIPLLNSEQYIELTLLTYYNRYGGASSNFTNPFNSFKDRGWVTSDASLFPEKITFDSSKIPNDNWSGAVFRTGITQEYQLSVSGGNEFVKAFVSGSFNTSQASTICNYFNRMTIRANIDFKINKWLEINNSTSFGNTSQRMPTDGGVIASPPRGVLNMIPYNRIYNDDGTLNTSIEGAQHTNPVQAAELNIYKLKTNKLTHNTDLVFKFLENFTFKVSGKVDYNTLDEQNYLDPRTPQGKAYEGFGRAIHNQIINVQTSEVLNYVKSFNGGKHRINALLGFEFKDYQRRMLSVSATGFPSPDFQLLSQAGSIDGFGQTFTGYRIIGTFARLGYTLNDKYIVNFVVRRDGSSRFGANQKWGTFPSVSAAWRIGEESFIKNNFNWVNDFKIKGGYGLTGNSDIGNFVAYPQFAGNNIRYDGLAGISPSIPGNLDLTWETKYSSNVGLELSMLDNRVSVALDYFDDVTKDLLYERTVPINSGYTNIWQNVGSVRNNGLELSLNVTPVKTKELSWTISPNFTWLKNRIVSLADGKDRIGNNLVVGQPIDNFYVYMFAGVNPADGRPMWYDKNKAITYVPVTEDRQFINGMYPTFYGGVSNTITWKGFDLSFLFQFQSGARRYNADNVQLSRVGNTVDRNQYIKMYTDYWRTPGQMTDVARPMFDNGYIGPGGKTTSYSAASSLHYDSTDFLKLKNISLSYTFPHRIVNKFGLQGLSLACNAFNLWTTTKYTGYDPEFIGSDSGTYPQSRTITFVLKLDL